jgi:hypothetical protein
MAVAKKGAAAKQKAVVRMKASLPGSDVLLTLSHVSPGSGDGDERGRTMARAGVNTQPQDPEEYKQHPPHALTP